MAGNQIHTGRSVTSKIAAILLTFSQGDVHTLTEIAQLARLPVSTAHRLVAELLESGLVERTAEGLYRVGSTLRRIEPPNQGQPTVEQLAPCIVEDLSAVTRTRARFGVMHGLEVAYIEKLPDWCPVSSFNAAARLPAHPTAIGRALLAFSPVATVEMVILLGLRSYTPHTTTDTAKFRRILAMTRINKVALARWQFEANCSTVAMPVFDPEGNAVAAFELTVRDFGSQLRTAVAALTVASRSLARELADGTAAALPALSCTR